MSGFNVSNRPPLTVHGAPLLQAEQSQSRLKDDMAHAWLGAGGVKPGVLRIDKRGAEQEWPRDRAPHMRTRHSAGFGAATHQIKLHVQQAYAGKVPATAFKGLMAGLDAYLHEGGNRLGSKTFAKLLNAFEKKAARDSSDDLKIGIVSPVKWTPIEKRVPQLLGRLHAADRSGQGLNARQPGAGAKAFELMEKAGDGPSVAARPSPKGLSSSAPSDEPANPPDTQTDLHPTQGD